MTSNAAQESSMGLQDDDNGINSTTALMHRPQASANRSTSEQSSSALSTASSASASKTLVSSTPRRLLPYIFPSKITNIRQRASVLAGARTTFTGQLQHPSSLDFERIVNEYTNQNLREREFISLDEQQQEQLETSSGVDGMHPIHEGNGEESDTEEDDDRRILESVAQFSYSTFNELLPTPTPPSRKTTMKRRNKPIGLYSGRGAIRWALTMMTGLLTGLIAILIVYLTDAIGEWRSHLINAQWRNDQSKVFIFSYYATTNLAMALLSASLCLFVAPEAIGSGIPEVKAYLNGVRVKRFASIPLFLVKICGTILSVGSGMILGPEGPLVHTGAVLGAGCTKISNTLVQWLSPSSSSRYYQSSFYRSSCWSFISIDLSFFGTDWERRDLVSIGAAAGFAAAFGAPIGGLLFSMEEASSYFEHRMFLRTLTATTIATFCLAIYHGDLSNYSIISLGNYETPNNEIFLSRAEEFPLYILVAIGGGVLGGIFCRCWESLMLFKKRRFPQAGARVAYKFAEVALVSLLTSILMYWIPLLRWTCLDAAVDLSANDRSSDRLLESMSEPGLFRAQQFNCPDGQVNELATIFFGSREGAISDILTDPKQFHPYTLLTVGLIFFSLMTLTLGVSLPTGIFMPIFLIGSSLGGAAGIYFQRLFPAIVATNTFALLGAAALLVGIQRSTVSLCVILVEGTGQVKILIPVIVTVVIARYVGDLISKYGLYETAIEVNRYPFLDHAETHIYDLFQVKDIMSPSPVVVAPRERAENLVNLLRESEHHGFPVVEPTTGKFLGLVRRDQLVASLDSGHFDEDVDEEAEEDGTGDLSTVSDDNESSSISIQRRSGSTPPGRRIAKSPLMRSAYYIEAKDNGRDDKVQVSRDEFSPPPPRALPLDDDVFDLNAWLNAVHQRRATLLAANGSAPTNGDLDHQRRHRGDVSLPPLRNSAAFRGSGACGNCQDCPIAILGTTEKGAVFVQWLKPEYLSKWVHVAGIMNLGVHCVREACPVSKAHYLFTALGLRHLVVIGGESGGQVVGLITRANLVKDHIEEKTGCDLS